MRNASKEGTTRNYSKADSLPPDSSLSGNDQASHGTTLTGIPAHLRIKVLYADDSVIVIDKPSNLRSVPGHANPAAGEIHGSSKQIYTNGKKRLRNESSCQQSSESEDIYNRANTAKRRTAQEAWVAAIQTFAQKLDESRQIPPITDHNREELLVDMCLRNLACTPNLSCIPRKRKLFQRYCQKNQQRIFHKDPNIKSSMVPTECFASIADQVYNRIEERQRPLLNLPESTSHEESALGQLVLLGFNKRDNGASNGLLADKDISPSASKCTRVGESVDSIFVVHRLDCETSGVMVFARNQEAASILGRAWRERDQVEKTYLARVHRWPPWQKEQQTEGSIDLPLAPSQTERLKWQVQKNGNGKPSKTLWKIQKSSDVSTSSGLILVLTPVTGRTHQLRIHCAAVGSGIEGDSLYGDNPVEWKAGKTTHATSSRLYLHAQKLKFLHPRTGEKVEFVSSPPWKGVDLPSTD